MSNTAPKLLILCHHPEPKAGPCMVTLRTVFLRGAPSCAASGRPDIAYAHLDGLRTLPGIVRALRADPDTILLFSSVNALRKPPALWALALNVWLLKRKQVVFWHEASSVVRVTAGLEGPSWWRRMFRRLHFAAVRHFLHNGLTWHLAVSMQTKQLVLFLLGVQPERVFVSGNAIDVERSPVRDRAPARAELRACMAGDPSWQKGLDIFIELAREFPAWRGQPVRYTWYGGTPEWLRQIEADARGEQIRRAGVRLAGFVSPLPDALKDEDLFVFTSRSDGFGLAALEALACDIPVFCFDSAGIAEILPPEFVCSCPADLKKKIEAYLKRRDRYAPGAFRNIALGCGRERFLETWRMLERAIGLTGGLPSP
ncbi:MAG TPA: glycosyltransferase family 4 protein [Kiritimatiellia bacterium]|nr:glycosyltransferase family 4 protein [Kiritimatiellia bacterium]HRZ11485.1 glycosyltransferase family 4 protein [Kiritimatiellia bacterium]HSA16964.1 glycosyltransferase family 4 protein [Kiritimatiellia bacterium]